MTNVENLITKARKYCIDNYSFWINKYATERSGSYKYTDKDYNIFPRYHVLEAILQDVETFVGQHFNSIEDCKNELILISKNSQNKLVSPVPNDIEKNAIQEERGKFAKYIESLTDEDFKVTDKLPYKRKLRNEESNQIRQKLLETWNFGGNYWHPIGDKSPNPTIFLMLNCLTELDIEEIIKKIAVNTEKKLYIFNEYREDYEIEIDSLSIDLSETICFDKTYNWVIYCSHEMTITFGGDWLIDFVRKLFVDRGSQLNKFEW